MGGRGLARRYERAFAELEQAYDVPVGTELFRVSIGLVAPTIVRFGSVDQKRDLLPRLLSAEEFACQLFSEPDAGSDIASVRCRAVRHGDGWKVDGQKIWTSSATVAGYGELIARTADGPRKHQGLTAFLVPLDLPGIEVRPIRQMTGGASFNEVFFDGVIVDDSCRLGAEGEGWSVTLTTLAYEREVSGDHHHEVGGSVGQILALARHLGLAADPVTRQAVADLWIRDRVLVLTGQRVAALTGAGAEAGPAGSIGKLMWTQTLQRSSEVASLLLGPRLVADSGEWGTYCWAEHVLGAPGYRIAGGSDEIQRTIIGERALGLPKEPAG